MVQIRQLPRTICMTTLQHAMQSRARQAYRMPAGTAGSRPPLLLTPQFHSSPASGMITELLSAPALPEPHRILIAREQQEGRRAEPEQGSKAAHLPLAYQSAIRHCPHSLLRQGTQQSHPHWSLRPTLCKSQTAQLTRSMPRGRRTSHKRPTCRCLQPASSQKPPSQGWPHYEQAWAMQFAVVRRELET